MVISLAMTVQGQKSRVLSVIQMIESEKYKEAKTAIDQIIENPSTSEWARTYYTRGLLCQTAFEAGVEKNDEALTSLYPDQLVFAYVSYERAIELKPGNRVRSAISVHYYSLANDFKLLGKKQYQSREYAKALESFEHALIINNSPLVEISLDTNLIYNTALAAYESKNWEKAIHYLTGLNDQSFSPRTALLLYKAQLQEGDTLRAEEVLADAVERYLADEGIVLQLVDLLAGLGKMEEAVQYLDRAMALHPENYHFPWTRGLLFEKMGRYEEAIADLALASELAPEEAGIHYSLGICYYNVGVAITEASRSMASQQQYQESREEANRQFRMAIEQLEKTKELDPGHADANSKLMQLYQYLNL
jgi:tetratricopeptide (TPR) repeat protein